MDEDIRKRVDALNRKWSKDNKSDKPRVTLGSDMEEPELIPTGNPALDRALGGGIPLGTIFEISGAPAVGKTTTMNGIVAEVQKTDRPIILYYCTEESKAPHVAWKLMGVDESNVIFIDSRLYAEDGVDVIKSILFGESDYPSDKIGMIVIDSLAAMAPQGEVKSVEKGGMGAPTVGRHPLMSSSMFRLICGGGWQSNGCLIGVVNQERVKIGPVPLPNTTTGGMAIQYYPKLRIRMKAPSDGFLLQDGDSITEGRANGKGKVIGHTVEFFISKNNTGSAWPYARGRWRVLYGKGVDYTGPVIDEAIELGVITSSGGGNYVLRWMEGDAPRSRKVRGSKSLYSILESSPDVINSLLTINAALRIGSDPDLLTKLLATEEAE